MGICSAEGVTYDFAGPYFISENQLGFGKTTRYIQLHPQCSPEEWNDAVKEANCSYENKMHNICFQNCHSHVATVLDKVKYFKFQNWNMIILAIWMFFFGRFPNTPAFLYSFAPSIVIYGLVVTFSLLL